MTAPQAFTRFVPAERPLSFSRLRPTRAARFKIRMPVVLTIAGIAAFGASAPALLTMIRHAEPTAMVADAHPASRAEDSRVAEIRAASDTSRLDWLGRLATATPPLAGQPGPDLAGATAASKSKDETAARQRREALAARIEEAASVTASITPGPALRPPPEKRPVRTIPIAAPKPREMKAPEAKTPVAKVPAKVEEPRVKPRAARLRKIRVREAKPNEAERPSLAERLFGRRASLFKPATPDTNR